MPSIWYAASLVADWTGEWIYLTLSLRDRFYCYVAQHYDFKGQGWTGYGWTLEPCSRGECSYPQAGKKVQRLFGNDPTVFQTCVLGLPGQVKKFDSNRLLLTVWDCLIPLPHRVIRATILFINLDVCLVFYHDWIVVAYIEWLIN